MTVMERDDGFTLVELVITIAITGIIMGAITTAFIAGFRITDETNARIAHSNDRHIVAAYFANDVQGAAAPEDGGVVIGTPASCGANDGTAIISFISKDTDAIPTEATVSVTYAFVDGILKRRYCDPSESDTDIATSLASSPTPDPSCLTSDRCELVLCELLDENGSCTLSYSLRGHRRSADD